jgi:AhpD family alkylhydroperoxidase
MIKKLAPEAYQHLYALDSFLSRSSLDPMVWELVKIRASQLNVCAFCVDMHTFAAHQAGESLERLFAVAVWREAPFFTGAERAALALSEAATVFEHGLVPACPVCALRVPVPRCTVVAPSTPATKNSPGPRSASSSAPPPPRQAAATGTSHDQLDEDHRHNADERASDQVVQPASISSGNAVIQ